MSKFSITVGPEDAGRSVKDVLRRNFSFSSRLMTRFKQNNCICLNGEPVKVNVVTSFGDVIDIGLPDEESYFAPEDVPIVPVYEDDDLLIIDKPAGYVVHPTKGHPAHTIANGLTRYMTDAGKPFKIRFVNRLDMDTTGLLLIAKNAHAQEEIVKQMHENKVVKKYAAVLCGIVGPDEGVIEAPVGGRPSTTRYRVVERYKRGYTLAELTIQTGRTHQIRVHMSEMGHPVVGDRLYGGEKIWLIERQALHAHFISFFHPITGKLIEVSAEMPEDMRKLLTTVSSL